MRYETTLWILFKRRRELKYTEPGCWEISLIKQQKRTHTNSSQISCVSNNVPINITLISEHRNVQSDSIQTRSNKTQTQLRLIFTNSGKISSVNHNVPTNIMLISGHRNVVETFKYKMQTQLRLPRRPTAQTCACAVLFAWIVAWQTLPALGSSAQFYTPLCGKQIQLKSKNLTRTNIKEEVVFRFMNVSTDFVTGLYYTLCFRCSVAWHCVVGIIVICQ